VTIFLTLHTSTLKTEAAHSSEMFVSVYRTAQYHSPDYSLNNTAVFRPFSKTFITSMDHGNSNTHWFVRRLVTTYKDAEPSAAMQWLSNQVSEEIDSWK
jgi:hypothetical protein